MIPTLINPFLRFNLFYLSCALKVFVAFNGKQNICEIYLLINFTKKNEINLHEMLPAENKI